MNKTVTKPGWYFIATTVIMLDRVQYIDKIYVALLNDEDARLKANRRAEALRGYLTDVLHTEWEIIS